MSAKQAMIFGAGPMTLAALDVVARAEAELSLAPAALDRIAAGRAVVDHVVEARIPAYGITTGVGSQKDYAVDPVAIAAYNNLLITGHATIAPGEDADPATVRAALAIQLSLYATGRSGVRPALVESLLARLVADDLPGAKLGSSIGASDIVGMSQLAVPLIGQRGLGEGGAGPMPIGQLHAKEALSLLNSNSLTLAGGALALIEARRLIDVSTSVAALSLEGLRGNPFAWSEIVDRSRGQPGQIKTGRALRALLQDSRLWQKGESRFLQDPLSFRCVPQIHGAVEAAYGFAAETWERELNAICDNPLLDLENQGFVSHGNMETTACTLALDLLRLALAKMVESANERLHKLQWPGFSGLPTGLAEEGGGAVGGVQFLNLGPIGAAATGHVHQASHPATLAYRGQAADGVEDVAGGAPFAVAETRRLLAPAWTAIAIEAICAVWAIRRRGLEADTLGIGLRPLYAGILPLLPIGREGREVFDMRPVVELLQAR
jgi:histidine ammonia-lyase